MTKVRIWFVPALVSLVALSLLACSAGPETAPAATPKPAAPTASAPSVSPPPSPPPAKPATTQATASVSFAGKTITVVVASAAGGSSDITGRVYSQFLPRYLPGKPAMIVRNMPGGANTIGSNFAYQAKPDGLTVLIGSASILLNPLIGLKAVKYDLLEMPLVINAGRGVVAYIKAGIVSKPEDIVKTKGLIFGTAPGSLAYQFITVKELLDIPTEKTALGYTGGADARRALLGGEIHFAIESSPAYLESVSQYVAKREVAPLFQTGLLSGKGDIVKDPSLPPDVPTVKELYEKTYGKPPSGVVWEAFKGVLAAGFGYSGGLFLSPQVPDSIVNAYNAACEALVKDPDFRKAAAPLVGADAVWTVGKPLQDEFRQNYGLKPEVREWLRAALPRYGLVVE